MFIYTGMVSNDGDFYVNYKETYLNCRSKACTDMFIYPNPMPLVY
jgi:hypothetical protein